MKKTILVTTLMLIGSFTAQADTLCSNADQTLKFVHDDVERGIPPQQGDLLYTETLVFNGRDFGVNEDIYGLDPRPKFRVDFLLATQNILEQKSAPGVFEKTYSIKIESMTDGLPGLGQVYNVDQFVMCVERTYLVP